MSPRKRYAAQHIKARQRRRRTAQERLARDHRQAQQAAEALQQALNDLGLPDDLVTEIAGRLRSQQKLLGKIVAILVEGKSTYVFKLPDGRQIKGHDLQQDRDWPWRSSPQVPGVRYAVRPNKCSETVPEYLSMFVESKG